MVSWCKLGPWQTAVQWAPLRIPVIILDSVLALLLRYILYIDIGVIIGYLVVTILCRHGDKLSVIFKLQ